MSDVAMNMSSASALTVRDPFALVPSLGNLDAYISAVNRIPLLTHEEELSYAKRLREQVTSPGGTTAAALKQLDDADLTGLVTRALQAAERRGKELAALG